MNRISQFILSLLIVVLFAQCKKETGSQEFSVPKNEIQYAKGFSMVNYDGYTVVTVSNPWPKAKKSYTYILKQKNGKIPDSLKPFTTCLLYTSRCV